MCKRDSNRTLIGDGANVSESDFCTIHHDASHVIVSQQSQERQIFYAKAA